jgi:hypothetical protein
LFQLRPSFVPGERIGIDEMGAEQILTNRLRANERGIALHHRIEIIAALIASDDHSPSPDFGGGGGTCGTDGLPLRKRG